MILGRTIPGFSSDSIRLDQARSTKRAPTNAARQNKLKILGEAKIAWRKEREEGKVREGAAVALVV
jgi:hypothetical protein